MSKLANRRAARRQSDLIGLHALAELLRSVATSPNSYLGDDALKTALSSQGAMAKFALPNKSITPMSLNHQRLIAETALGSYEALDVLRRAAKQALVIERVRAERGHVRTKAGLSARVKELQSDAALLMQDLALLQRAYDLRCVQARNYAAKADKVTQALCTKEQRELDASFSLRRKSAGASNVVEISEARQHARPKH